jgi:simple sugar transport system ATP-binding protein
VCRRVADSGCGVVLVTHKLAEIRQIADRVTVLRAGRTVASSTTPAADIDRLVAAMIARDSAAPPPPERQPPQAMSHDLRDEVLQVDGLSVTDAHGGLRLDNFTLVVNRGEIVGIAGVEGNGQTELIETLAGLAATGHTTTGKVEFGGRNITRLNARARRELGIAHIPEDRHRRGLLLDFDLAENSILGDHYRKPAVSGPGNVFLNDRGIRERALQVINDFDVRPADPDLPARSLSGGNQQKLIIGREFELNPKLLLVSQPTRGVDIGAIEFIHRKLVGLRDAGCAVLLVSAELEEVTALADRLLIMREGRIVGEVDPKQATVEEIGLLMTGGKH